MTKKEAENKMIDTTQPQNEPTCKIQIPKETQNSIKAIKDDIGSIRGIRGIAISLIVLELVQIMLLFIGVFGD